MGGFCLLVELRREGSAPAACAAGLFYLKLDTLVCQTTQGKTIMIMDYGRALNLSRFAITITNTEFPKVGTLGQMPLKSWQTFKFFNTKVHLFI